MIFYPAPRLTQGADEELVLEIGNVLYPGMVERPHGEDTIRVWVAGERGDSAYLDTTVMFETILGVLRAWRPDAGQRIDDREVPTSRGLARDKTDAHTLYWESARFYVRAAEVSPFAAAATRRMADSLKLREALEIHGRASRTAAEYHNILELFASERGIRDLSSESMATALDVEHHELKMFYWSANNLAARHGGRHTRQDRLDHPPAPGETPWALDQLCDFAGHVLRTWIGPHVAL